MYVGISKLQVVVKHEHSIVRSFLFQFEDYLFSKDNQAFDTSYDKVYQDMTHPLAHYWIASSHNT